MESINNRAECGVIFYIAYVVLFGPFLCCPIGSVGVCRCVVDKEIGVG